MTAPLPSFTREEQRSVIRFLWSKGVSGTAIHQRLSAQYGNSVLSLRSVYEWIEKFKNGRTYVTHDEGAGRPSTATNEDNVVRARDMVLLDRQVTVDEVAHRLQISHGSAYEIIHNRLGLHKVCGRWVPKAMTGAEKQRRYREKRKKDPARDNLYRQKHNERNKKYNEKVKGKSQLEQKETKEKKVMTPAEKQRRYREKRKNDPIRENLYKQKHKERNKKRYKKEEDMSQLEQKEAKGKWVLTPAEKQRRYREKRKNDPARENLYKQQHNERNKKYHKKVKDMSQSEHMDAKLKWKMRANRSRLKRRGLQSALSFSTTPEEFLVQEPEASVSGYQQKATSSLAGSVEVFIKQEIKEERNSPEGVFQQEAIEFEALVSEMVDASRSEETYRMQPWSLCSVKFEPEEESEEPQLSTSLNGDEEYPALEIQEFKEEIKMNIGETEESEGPVEVFIKQEIKEEPEELEEVTLQEASGLEASQLEIAN